MESKKGVSPCFTDVQLERLRDALKVTPEFSLWAERDLEMLKALLHRLECAESLIRYSQKPRDDMKWLKLFTAWKQSKGEVKP